MNNPDGFAGSGYIEFNGLKRRDLGKVFEESGFVYVEDAVHKAVRIGKDNVLDIVGGQFQVHEIHLDASAPLPGLGG